MSYNENKKLTTFKGIVGKSDWELEDEIRAEVRREIAEEKQRKLEDARVTEEQERVKAEQEKREAIKKRIREEEELYDKYGGKWGYELTIKGRIQRAEEEQKRIDEWSKDWKKTKERLDDKARADCMERLGFILPELRK